MNQGPRVITLREPLTFTNGMSMSPSDIAVLVHFARLGGVIVRVESCETGGCP